MSVVKAIFSRLALVFVWLLEHGYLPDVLARWAVRRLIGFYLSKLNAGACLFFFILFFLVGQVKQMETELQRLIFGYWGSRDPPAVA